MVIQIAQPQVCYPNPKQDTLDLKSSMCHKVFNAAKTILNVHITGKDLFESIGSLSAPAPLATFKFTSTKVNPVPKPISKASTLLKPSLHTARPLRLSPSSLKPPSQFGTNNTQNVADLGDNWRKVR